MVEKKKDANKSIMKPVSITKKEVKIIEYNLNCYGDFSGFVRFCLNDEELINRYKQI